jgi:hypothetical protein
VAITAEPAAEKQTPPEPEKSGRLFDPCFRVETVAKVSALNGDFGDVDGDRKRDVVGIDLDAVTVLRADGKGFTAMTSAPLQPDSFAAAIADLDGDGHGDVITVEHKPGSLTVMMTDKGALGAPRTMRLAARASDAPAVLDLDGDHHLDLVLPLARELQVLHGDGTGKLRAGPRRDAGEWASRPVAADLDGDGDLDVLAAANDSHFLGVFLNQQGKLDQARRYPCGRGGANVAVGDFDGDGTRDVAMGNVNSLTTCLFRGTGGGELTQIVELGHGGLGLAAHDFDGDGRHEILLAGRHGGLRLFRARADGSAETLVELDIDGVRDVWVDDVDGDGRDDIIALAKPGLVVAYGRGC